MPIISRLLRDVITITSENCRHRPVLRIEWRKSEAETAERDSCDEKCFDFTGGGIAFRNPLQSFGGCTRTSKRLADQEPEGHRIDSIRDGLGRSGWQVDGDFESRDRRIECAEQASHFPCEDYARHDGCACEGGRR